MEQKFNHSWNNNSIVTAVSELKGALVQGRRDESSSADMSV